MAYLKPPAATVKVFNPLVMKLGWFDVATLVVDRRGGTGAERIPVIPIDVDGAMHVVSTRGESDWVQNLRSAGNVRLERGGLEADFTAAELPVAERAPVIAAYRDKAGKQVEGYWKKLPDDADHPVFRLTPA